QLGRAKEETELKEGFLADYESLHYPKEAIELNDIFLRNKQATNAHKKLIYGRAGIGKSTLVHYAAYQWAGAKLWPEFNYVFWLPLRELTSDWKKLYNKGELRNNALACFIHHCCSDNTIKLNGITSALAREDPSKILLLLDGYDEIAQLHNKQNSLISNVLNKAIKGSFYVLMTSRPNAVGKEMQQHFDAKFLETIGLTDNNITEYIKKYYQQAISDQSAVHKDGLLRFVEVNKAIKGIVHIPINLLLLCLVWQELQKKQANKTCNDEYYLTLSNLYKEVVNWLLKRYLEKSHHATWLKYGDANIAEYDIKKLCQDEYRALEQLAFEGLETKQLILMPQLIEKLEISGSILENVKKIGLLKAIGDDGKLVNNKEHYFIHLTFQEYFAARYIVGLLAHPDPGEVKRGTKFI
ncbi:MAG: NACHT domain-containing protein, partial [Burkholderiales bacterium]